jgi:exodeoxyribonuclease-1
MRHVADRGAEAYAHWLMLTNRRAISEMLDICPFLLKVDDRTPPMLRAIAPLGPNPARPTEHLALDLTVDPEPLFSLSVDELTATFSKNLRLLQVVHVNHQPLLASADTPIGARLMQRPTISPDVSRWARAVEADEGFRQCALEAGQRIRPTWPAPRYVDEALYAEFFPMRADAPPIVGFHAAPPPRKAQWAAQFSDPRAKELSRRLLFELWPQALTPEEQADLIDEMRERMMTEADVPWTTVPKALREIAKLRLRPTAIADDLKILDECERALMPSLRWP